jgi:hypothetical protein
LKNLSRSFKLSDFGLSSDERTKIRRDIGLEGRALNINSATVDEIMAHSAAKTYEEKDRIAFEADVAKKERDQEYLDSIDPDFNLKKLYYNYQKRKGYKKNLVDTNVFALDTYNTGYALKDKLGSYDNFHLGIAKMEEESFSAFKEAIYEKGTKSEIASLEMFSNPFISSDFKSLLADNLFSQDKFETNVNFKTAIENLAKQGTEVAKQYFGEEYGKQILETLTKEIELTPYKEHKAKEDFEESQMQKRIAKSAGEGYVLDTGVKSLLGFGIRMLEDALKLGATGLGDKDKLYDYDDNLATDTLNVLADGLHWLRDEFNLGGNWSDLVEVKSTGKDLFDITTTSNIWNEKNKQDVSKKLLRSANAFASGLGELAASIGMAASGVGLATMVGGVGYDIAEQRMLNDGRHTFNNSDLMTGLLAGVVVTASERLASKFLFHGLGKRKSITQNQLDAINKFGRGTLIGLTGATVEGAQEFFQEGFEDFAGQFATERYYKEGYDYGQTMARALNGAILGAVGGGTIKSASLLKDGIRGQYNIVDNVLDSDAIGSVAYQNDLFSIVTKTKTDLTNINQQSVEKKEVTTDDIKNSLDEQIKNENDKLQALKNQDANGILEKRKKANKIKAQNDKVGRLSEARHLVDEVQNTNYALQGALANSIAQGKAFDEKSITKFNQLQERQRKYAKGILTEKEYQIFENEQKNINIQEEIRKTREAFEYVNQQSGELLGFIIKEEENKWYRLKDTAGKKSFEIKDSKADIDEYIKEILTNGQKFTELNEHIAQIEKAFKLTKGIQSSLLKENTSIYETQLQQLKDVQEVVQSSKNIDELKNNISYFVKDDGTVDLKKVIRSVYTSESYDILKQNLINKLNEKFKGSDTVTETTIKEAIEQNTIRFVKAENGLSEVKTGSGKDTAILNEVGSIIQQELNAKLINGTLKNDAERKQIEHLNLLLSYTNQSTYTSLAEKQEKARKILRNKIIKKDIDDIKQKISDLGVEVDIEVDIEEANDYENYTKYVQIYNETIAKMNKTTEDEYNQKKEEIDSYTVTNEELLAEINKDKTADEDGYIKEADEKDLQEFKKKKLEELDTTKKEQLKEEEQQSNPAELDSTQLLERSEVEGEIVDDTDGFKLSVSDYQKSDISLRLNTDTVENSEDLITKLDIIYKNRQIEKNKSSSISFVAFKDLKSIEQKFERLNEYREILKEDSRTVEAELHETNDSKTDSETDSEINNKQIRLRNNKEYLRVLHMKGSQMIANNLKESIKHSKDKLQTVKDELEKLHNKSELPNSVMGLIGHINKINETIHSETSALFEKRTHKNISNSELKNLDNEKKENLSNNIHTLVQTIESMESEHSNASDILNEALKEQTFAALKKELQDYVELFTETQESTSAGLMDQLTKIGKIVNIGNSVNIINHAMEQERKRTTFTKIEDMTNNRLVNGFNTKEEKLIKEVLKVFLNQGNINFSSTATEHLNEDHKTLIKELQQSSSEQNKPDQAIINKIDKLDLNTLLYITASANKEKEVTSTDIHQLHTGIRDFLNGKGDTRFDTFVDLDIYKGTMQYAAHLTVIENMYISNKQSNSFKKIFSNENIMKDIIKLKNLELYAQNLNEIKDNITIKNSTVQISSLIENLETDSSIVGKGLESNQTRREHFVAFSTAAKSIFEEIISQAKSKPALDKVFGNTFDKLFFEVEKGTLTFAEERIEEYKEAYENFLNILELVSKTDGIKALKDRLNALREKGAYRQITEESIDKFITSLETFKTNIVNAETDLTKQVVKSRTDQTNHDQYAKGIGLNEILEEYKKFLTGINEDKSTNVASLLNADIKNKYGIVTKATLSTHSNQNLGYKRIKIYDSNDEAETNLTLEDETIEVNGLNNDLLTKYINENFGDKLEDNPLEDVKLNKDTFVKVVNNIRYTIKTRGEKLVELIEDELNIENTIKKKKEQKEKLESDKTKNKDELEKLDEELETLKKLKKEETNLNINTKLEESKQTKKAELTKKLVETLIELNGLTDVVDTLNKSGKLTEEHIGQLKNAFDKNFTNRSKLNEYKFLREKFENTITITDFTNNDTNKDVLEELLNYSRNEQQPINQEEIFEGTAYSKYYISMKFDGKSLIEKLLTFDKGTVTFGTSTKKIVNFQEDLLDQYEVLAEGKDEQAYTLSIKQITNPLIYRVINNTNFKILDPNNENEKKDFISNIFTNYLDMDKKAIIKMLKGYMPETRNTESTEDEVLLKVYEIFEQFQEGFNSLKHNQENIAKDDNVPLGAIFNTNNTLTDLKTTTVAFLTALEQFSMVGSRTTIADVDGETDPTKKAQKMISNMINFNGLNNLGVNSTNDYFTALFNNLGVEIVNKQGLTSITEDVLKQAFNKSDSIAKGEYKNIFPKLLVKAGLVLEVKLESNAKTVVENIENQAKQIDENGKAVVDETSYGMANKIFYMANQTTDELNNILGKGNFTREKGSNRISLNSFNDITVNLNKKSSNDFEQEHHILKKLSTLSKLDVNQKMTQYIEHNLEPSASFNKNIINNKVSIKGVEVALKDLPTQFQFLKDFNLQTYYIKGELITFIQGLETILSNPSLQNEEDIQKIVEDGDNKAIMQELMNLLITQGFSSENKDIDLKDISNRKLFKHIVSNADIMQQLQSIRQYYDYIINNNPEDTVRAVKEAWKDKVPKKPTEETSDEEETSIQKKLKDAGINSIKDITIKKIKEHSWLLESTPIYVSRNMSKNGRYSINSQLFNPQSNKLLRSFVTTIDSMNYSLEGKSEKDFVEANSQFIQATHVASGGKLDVDPSVVYLDQKLAHNMAKVLFGETYLSIGFDRYLGSGLKENALMEAIVKHIGGDSSALEKLIKGELDSNRGDLHSYISKYSDLIKVTPRGDFLVQVIKTIYDNKGKSDELKKEEKDTFDKAVIDFFKHQFTEFHDEHGASGLNVISEQIVFHELESVTIGMEDEDKKRLAVDLARNTLSGKYGEEIITLKDLKEGTKAFSEYTQPFFYPRKENLYDYIEENNAKNFRPLTTPFISKILHETDGKSNGPYLVNVETNPIQFYKHGNELIADLKHDGNISLKEVLQKQNSEDTIRNTGVPLAITNLLNLAGAGALPWAAKPGVDGTEGFGKNNREGLHVQMIMILNSLGYLSQKLPANTEYDQALTHARMLTSILRKSSLFKELIKNSKDVDIEKIAKMLDKLDTKEMNLTDLTREELEKTREGYEKILDNLTELIKNHYTKEDKTFKETSFADEGFLKKLANEIYSEESNGDNYTKLLKLGSLKIDKKKFGAVSKREAAFPDVYEIVGMVTAEIFVADGRIPEYMQEFTAKDLSRKLMKYPVMTQGYNAADLATLLLHGNDIADFLAKETYGLRKKSLQTDNLLIGENKVINFLNQFMTDIEKRLGTDYKGSSFDLYSHGIKEEDLRKRLKELKNALKGINNLNTATSKEDINKAFNELDALFRAKDALLVKVIGNMQGHLVTEAINSTFVQKNSINQATTSLAQRATFGQINHEVSALMYQNVIATAFSLSQQYTKDDNNTMNVTEILNKLGKNKGTKNLQNTVSEIFEKNKLSAEERKKAWNEIQQNLDSAVIGQMSTIKVGKGVTIYIGGMETGATSSQNSLGTTVMQVHTKDGLVMGGIAVGAKGQNKTEFKFIDIYDATLTVPFDIVNSTEVFSNGLVSSLVSLEKHLFELQEIDDDTDLKPEQKIDKYIEYMNLLLKSGTITKKQFKDLIDNNLKDFIQMSADEETITKTDTNKDFTKFKKALNILGKDLQNNSTDLPNSFNEYINLHTFAMKLPYLKYEDNSKKFLINHVFHETNLAPVFSRVQETINKISKPEFTDNIADQITELINDLAELGGDLYAKKANFREDKINTTNDEIAKNESEIKQKEAELEKIEASVLTKEAEKSIDSQIKLIQDYMEQLSKVDLLKAGDNYYRYEDYVEAKAMFDKSKDAKGTDEKAFVEYINSKDQYKPVITNDENGLDRKMKLGFSPKHNLEQGWVNSEHLLKKDTFNELEGTYEVMNPFITNNKLDNYKEFVEEAIKQTFEAGSLSSFDAIKQLASYFVKKNRKTIEDDLIAHFTGKNNEKILNDVLLRSVLAEKIYEMIKEGDSSGFQQQLAKTLNDIDYFNDEIAIKQLFSSVKNFNDFRNSLLKGEATEDGIKNFIVDYIKAVSTNQTFRTAKNTGNIFGTIINYTNVEKNLGTKKDQELEKIKNQLKKLEKSNAIIYIDKGLIKLLEDINFIGNGQLSINKDKFQLKTKAVDDDFNLNETTPSAEFKRKTANLRNIAKSRKLLHKDITSFINEGKQKNQSWSKAVENTNTIYRTANASYIQSVLKESKKGNFGVETNQYEIGGNIVNPNGTTTFSQLAESMKSENSFDHISINIKTDKQPTVISTYDAITKGYNELTAKLKNEAEISKEDVSLADFLTHLNELETGKSAAFLDKDLANKLVKELREEIQAAVSKDNLSPEDIILDIHYTADHHNYEKWGEGSKKVKVDKDNSKIVLNNIPLFLHKDVHVAMKTAEGTSTTKIVFTEPQENRIKELLDKGDIREILGEMNNFAVNKISGQSVSNDNTPVAKQRLIAIYRIQLLKALQSYVQSNVVDSNYKTELLEEIKGKIENLEKDNLQSDEAVLFIATGAGFRLVSIKDKLSMYRAQQTKAFTKMIEVIKEEVRHLESDHYIDMADDPTTRKEIINIIHMFNTMTKIAEKDTSNHPILTEFKRRFRNYYTDNRGKTIDENKLINAVTVAEEFRVFLEHLNEGNEEKGYRVFDSDTKEYISVNKAKMNEFMTKFNEKNQEALKKDDVDLGFNWYISTHEITNNYTPDSHKYEPLVPKDLYKATHKNSNNSRVIPSSYLTEEENLEQSDEQTKITETRGTALKKGTLSFSDLYALAQMVVKNKNNRSTGQSGRIMSNHNILYKNGIEGDSTAKLNSKIETIEKELTIDELSKKLTDMKYDEDIQNIIDKGVTLSFNSQVDYTKTKERVTNTINYVAGFTQDIMYTQLGQEVLGGQTDLDGMLRKYESSQHTDVNYVTGVINNTVNNLDGFIKENINNSEIVLKELNKLNSRVSLAGYFKLPTGTRDHTSNKAKIKKLRKLSKYKQIDEYAQFSSGYSGYKGGNKNSPIIELTSKKELELFHRLSFEYAYQDNAFSYSELENIIENETEMAAYLSILKDEQVDSNSLAHYVNYKFNAYGKEITVMPTEEEKDKKLLSRQGYKIVKSYGDVAIVERTFLGNNRVNGLLKSPTHQTAFLDNNIISKRTKELLKGTELEKYVFTNKEGEEESSKLILPNKELYDIARKVNPNETQKHFFLKAVAKTEETNMLEQVTKEHIDASKELIQTGYNPNSLMFKINEGTTFAPDEALKVGQQYAKVTEEEFENLPSEIKKFINGTSGAKQTLYVRKAFKDAILGYQPISLAEWLTGKETISVNSPLGRTLRTLEKYFQGLVSMSKRNIIITPAYIVANFISGVVMAMIASRNLTPLETIKNIYEGTKVLNTVQKTIDEVITDFRNNASTKYKDTPVTDITKLLKENVANKISKKFDYQDIRDILPEELVQSLLENSIIQNSKGKNIVRDQVVDGLLASVVDNKYLGFFVRKPLQGVAMVGNTINIFRSKKSRQEAFRNIKGSGADILGEIFATPESANGRMLNSVIQWSDFVNRYAIYKGNKDHLSKLAGRSGTKYENLTKDDVRQIAIDKSMDYMIDYNRVLPKGVHFLDSFGLVPFATFMLRAQKILPKLMYDSYIGDKDYKGLGKGKLSERTKTLLSNTEWTQGVLKGMMLGSQGFFVDFMGDELGLRHSSYDTLSASYLSPYHYINSPSGDVSAISTAMSNVGFGRYDGEFDVSNFENLMPTTVSNFMDMSNGENLLFLEQK